MYLKFHGKDTYVFYIYIKLITNKNKRTNEIFKNSNTVFYPCKSIYIL